MTENYKKCRYEGLKKVEIKSSLATTSFIKKKLKKLIIDEFEKFLYLLDIAVLKILKFCVVSCLWMTSKPNQWRIVTDFGW